MRAVVQKVTSANVTVKQAVIGTIGRGLLIFIGIEETDSQKDIDYIVDKSVNLRVFDDENGVMNFSAMNIAGELLVVSQFTIMGDVRRGRRPSYILAAQPDAAKRIYENTVQTFIKTGLKIETGLFAADMLVNLQNDGPVTILLDSKKLF